MKIYKESDILRDMFDLDLFLFIYKELSVPCFEYLDASETRIIIDQKEEKIIHLIEKFNPKYNILYRGEALIFSKLSVDTLKETSALLVSIHRDTVFHTHDSSILSSTHKIKEGTGEIISIAGNIDNTIHCAIAVFLMIKEELPENVLFAFTLGEESSNMKKKPEYWMSGAAAALEWIRTNEISLNLAMVLDICYFDPEKNILSLIRNNYAEQYWDRIIKTAKKFSTQIEFIERLGTNETLFYSKMGIPTLNITAPSDTKSIHSLDAEISSKRVEHTTALLKYLFDNLREWYQ
jgi:hypothetical protein